MTVIVAALTGFFGGRMLWLAIRKSWSRQAFMRQNFQGITLPTAAGIVLALTLLLVEAARSIMGAIGVGEEPGLTGLRAAAFVVVLAFTLLGLLDDLVGTTGARGFNGHVQALLRGELTSGMIKLIAGGAAALVAASLIGTSGIGALLIDAAIIALTANLFNLLDVRPGRSTKVGLAVFGIVALVAAFDTALVPAAIVVGAAAALLLDDLHERLMLGDTGANALGAALGLGIATQLEGTGRLIALGALIGLNVLSEFVSFSKVIDAVPPLRVLDQMGRRRPPVIDLREDVYGYAGEYDELDAEPLAPYGDPDRSPFTASPIPPSYSGRGNVGGARDADRMDSARQDVSRQEASRSDVSSRAGEPAAPASASPAPDRDLFGDSDDVDFDFDDDFDDPLRGHYSQSPGSNPGRRDSEHRHN